MNCEPREIAIITRTGTSGCRCQTCILALSLVGRIVWLGSPGMGTAWKLSKPLETRWWEIFAIDDSLLTPLRAKFDPDEVQP